jgi:ABC-2 type transport system permease protein
VTTPAPTLAPHPVRHATLKVTFGRVVRSEWIKFRTLRSTYWILAVYIFLAGGFGLGYDLFNNSDGPTLVQGRANYNHVSELADITIQFALMFGIMVLPVLGVVLVTNEYSSGMIRSTFVAVPRRLPVLWAKAFVAAAVTGVIVLVGELIVFAIGVAVLSSRGADTTIDPAIWRAIAGGAVLAILFMWLFMGLGALLRSSAGGIVTAYGLAFLVPQMLLPLLSMWKDFFSELIPYFPMNALGLAEVQPEHMLRDTLTCVGWAAASLALGAWRFKLRDA